MGKSAGAMIVLMAVLFGFVAWLAHIDQGSAKAQVVPQNGATEAIHLTKADGVKSIGQLIREQHPSGWESLPDRGISSVFFFVDPFNDALILPRIEPFMPPGFQLGVLPGQDKKLFTPRNPLTVRQGLDLYLVRTTGVCNFLLIVEFYD